MSNYNNWVIWKKFKSFKNDFTNKVAEIDNIIIQSKWLEKVVIWEIKKISIHPNADNMQITETDIWSKIIQIICWAKNIYQGQKVAVALIWSVLPSWFKIKQVNKRWKESYWMICSRSELWLEGDNNWIMELSKEANVWTNFA